MSHAPEPWREGVAGNFRIYAADGHGGRSGPILEAMPRAFRGEDRANIARAVACVNAMAGLAPEQIAAIPRLVAWYRNWFWQVDWNTPEASQEYVHLGKIFGAESRSGSCRPAAVAGRGNDTGGGIQVDVKHRYTDAVIATGDTTRSACEESKADLSGAYLSGADLSGANLSGANLRGAYLSGADLSGANLSDADLSGAYLGDAYLRGANLSGANLRGANLRGADLREAYLSGAYLGDAVPTISDIDRAILAAIEAGGTLAMGAWHTCETTHCRAGWAIHLAGTEGAKLEDAVGACAAGALIYAASRPDKPVPDFYASDDEAMADLRACAGVE